MFSAMRVALIHDFLTEYGGAERVLLALHDIFPDSDVYSIIYIPENLPDEFKSWKITELGWSRYIPFKKRLYKYFLLLYPAAVEQFRLEQYDLCISSSYLWAKGVLTRKETCHICYCHTPMRQAWELYYQYKGFYAKNIPRKLAYSYIFHYLRMWDYLSAQRVDYFIANSENVRRRIKKYYNRESKVIYPPVNIDGIPLSDGIDDYYVLVSRLVPYKKVDLVLDAFRYLPDEKLVIIGSGQEEKKLRRCAPSNVEFTGWLSDEGKYRVISRAKALIFPQEEDFGITAVEALATGRPVIAYGKGGVLETVLPGKTGKFFAHQRTEDIVDVIRNFDPYSFEPELLRNSVLRFDKKNFIENVRLFVENSLEEYSRIYG